ncbi:MAG TPA: hypothetical protein PLP20_02950 [Oscillospiraceae bacterium]|nr:hypothetical protein [Oscillospiraceae bacterium]HNW04067.1 hypothetical protein [Oscillospiraceae bacterium]HPV99994.1 hypothetical protein [Oscillospiraceae bacterium]
MKKTIALLMVCSFLMALAGCGNGGTPTPGSSSAVAESSAAPLPATSGTA